jgi:glycosyltransferase involved in cell wall biosynthesis
MIVIYRTVYRLPSEVFIREQAVALPAGSAMVWCREETKLANIDRQSLPCTAVAARGRLGKLMFTFLGLGDFGGQVPKLIHAHFGPDAAVILPAARRMHVPLIATFHGFDIQRSALALLKEFRPTNWVYLLRRRRLFREASKIIAVSEFIRGRLIQRGCPPEKILVHYTGVDVGRACPAQQPRETALLVHVGRHVSWKGIDTLLEALAIIRRHVPEARLKQVGAGPDTARLKEQAAALGLSDAVEWVGATDHESVLSLMRRASVYVHPSREDDAGQTEAFGMAVLEAQACGVPVVASRTGGIPEAMEDNETGFLFREGCSQDLAEKALALLRDRAQNEQFGTAARAFAVRRFDIRKQSEELQRIYDQAIRPSAQSRQQESERCAP